MSAFMPAARRLSPLLLPVLLAAWSGAAPAAGPAPAARWVAQRVQQPPGTAAFPGDSPGARAANANCLMCHSADMVLNQPALGAQAWLAEVNKMRDAFKAPIAPDQVQLIADYLATIKGKP
jgi:cytochrome c5